MLGFLYKPMLDPSFYVNMHPFLQNFAIFECCVNDIFLIKVFGYFCVVQEGL
jgi:hypothetical protein